MKVINKNLTFSSLALTSTVLLLAVPGRMALAGTPSGTPWSIPGIIQADTYDTGGQGVGYYSPNNSGIALEPCNDIGGGYDVCDILNDEWLNYTSAVPTSASYFAYFRIATPYNNTQLSLLQGSSSTGPVTLPYTGGWQNWTTVRGRINLTSETAPLELYCNTNGFNLNYYTVSPPAPWNVGALGAEGQAVVTWSSVPGATSYNLYHTVNGYVDGTTPFVTGITGTSFTETGLPNGTYYYKVEAVSSYGTSPQSQYGASATITGQTAPPPPNITGVTVYDNEAEIFWNNTVNGALYKVYRGTTPGGESSTPVQTVSSPGVVDLGLTNGVTYYYYVETVSSAGTSCRSVEVSATPFNYAINSGGSPAITTYAVPYFSNDYGFTGGSIESWSNSIDTSYLNYPVPPPAVLTTDRIGPSFSYTLSNMGAAVPHQIILYFVENYWSTAGSRIFNVTANGVPVLTNFDVFAAAGAKSRAVQETITATPNNSGQVTLQFTSVKDQAEVNGIVVN